MAARTAVFVDTHGLGLPNPLGQLHLEVWRVTTATAGDTSVIVPRRGRFIAAAIGVPSDVSTSGSSTNVTITLAGPSDLLLMVAE